MNNLKISLRIMLGFGAIICGMLAFVVFVLISNNTTATNVNRMQDNSQLQTLTKDLMARFYDARLNATVICIKNDDEAYAKVTANFSEVRDYAQSINELIATDENLSRFEPEIDAAMLIIEEWQQEVASVQEANKSVDKFVVNARANKLHLSSKSGDIFDYHLALLQGEAARGVPAAMISNLDYTVTLSGQVDTIGATFEAALKSYDISGLPKCQELLTTTVEGLKNFATASADTFNEARCNELLGFLETVNNDIERFMDICEQREALADAARSKGQQALDAINVLLKNIDMVTADLAAATSAAASRSMLIILVIAAFSMVFAIAFSLMLAKNISRPVVKMHDIIEQVGSSGNLTFEPEVLAGLHAEANFKNEISQSMSSFIRLLDHLVNTGDQLERVAKGDLSIDIRLLSEEDTIGKAVSHMVGNLNQMFGDINSCSEQVTFGSKQIALGAQNLSMGTTEQAASVEQLSASIESITRQTAENVQLAKSASALAEAIRERAEVGSKQMEHMTAAVAEINQASQDIGKVIKVIDDIAFQTNILALNAAVEAARAGQHGKGFAVVAEEVRSLATKSAEAAKNTGSLIVSSMEKAALGAKIAGETAESLAEIVSGVNKSTGLINDIALSSENQSMSIEQINSGINQIAHVVQENSATAEQSAAAAQELSGQSCILEEMVHKFTLRSQNQLYLEEKNI